MSVIDIDVALAHVRADSGEQAQVQIYLDAAEDAAMQFLNRLVYSDADALNAAIQGVPASVAAGQAAYDSASASADALPEGAARDIAMAKARNDFDRVLSEASEIYAGIVINPSIRAAVLLTMGHLFANRESVMTGVRAAAVEIPMGAQALLMPYRVSMGA